MSLETKEFPLDDRVYSVTMIPAGKAGKLATRIFKLAGVAFTNLATPADEDTPVEKQVSINMSNAIKSLVEGMDKDDVAELVQTLIKESNVRIDNRALIYDVDFAGAKYFKHTLQLAWFIVDFNFGGVDFFTTAGISG